MGRKSLVIILSCFLTLSVCCQNAVIDSLENKLKTVGDDSVRMACLVELVFNTKFADTLKAKKFAEEALAIATKSKNAKFLAAAYRIAGVLEETHFRHTQALDFFYRGIAQLAGNTDRHATFLNAVLKLEIGNVYLYQASLSTAIPYYFEALHYFEEKQANNVILVFLYNNLSTTYGLAGQPNKAIEYVKKAVVLAERLKNKRAMAYAYSQMSVVLLQVGNLEEGHLYNEKVRTLAESLGDYALLGESEAHLGIYYHRKNDLEASLQHCKKAIIYYEKIYRHLHIGELYDFMGTQLKESGDLNGAKKYFGQALRIAVEVNCAHLRRNSLKHMSEVSEALRELPLAMSYYRKYLRINDSLMRHDEKTQIFIAEVKFESEKQQAQIAALEKEKVQQSSVIRDKNLQNFILLAGLVLGVIIFALVWYNFKSKQQLIVHQNELQQKKINDLEKDRHLIAVESLLKGQEEERSRLARDIHDGLGSVLSSVKHSLTSMKGNLIVTSENMEVFNKSVNLIDYSMTELRRVAHNMMPESLLRFGLNESLRDFCESITSGKLRVKYISLNADERFENSKEIVAYRTVQELVTNTLKHADATNLLVQLSREENLVTLTVEDNGRGFDPDKLHSSKGAGWTNIYSRVEYLKGKIELDSKPGFGTSVTIEFYV